MLEPPRDLLSERWAAFTAGDTRRVLASVRRVRPSTFDAIRGFLDAVAAGRYDTEQIPVQLHELLDAETSAITSEADEYWWSVHDALEKLATTRLHPLVFGCGDETADQALQATLRRARQELTAERLGIAPEFSCGSAWATPAVMLHRLGRYRAPADKVTLIVNACRIIERKLHALGNSRPPQGTALLSGDSSGTGAAAVAGGVGDEEAAAAAADGGDRADRAEALGSPHVVGADEFFPVLIWVVARSDAQPEAAPPPSSTAPKQHRPEAPPRVSAPPRADLLEMAISSRWRSPRDGDLLRTARSAEAAAPILRPVDESRPLPASSATMPPLLACH